MHPRRSAQKVLLCHLCETDPLQNHCELCDISLCKACVGEHLSDSSKRHKVVPFLQRQSTHNYTICPYHADKHCKHYCEKCAIPICITCVSSGEHKGHDISDILEKLGANTERLHKDLEELETRIYPRYEEMASGIQSEKANIETNYDKLTTAADQQGEILHREIEAIVIKRKSDIQEMKNKHLSTLNKNTEEITQKDKGLKQIIADLKSILKSNDVYLTSTYKSRNSEFRTFPPKVRVTLPSFSPQEINKDWLNEMFGSLSTLSITKGHYETMKSPEAVSSSLVKPMESIVAVSSPSVKPMKSPEVVSSPPVKPMKSPEVVSSPPVKPMTSPETVSYPPVKPMKSPETVSSPPVKQLCDEPRFTDTIDTGYGGLYSVCCLSEDQIWTRGNNEIMKLLNVQGKLMSFIKTKSSNCPEDIAVTSGGNLVYTDTTKRTVNLMKNKQIRAVITLKGWEPRYICCTASDELLITMISDDGEQSKVVRYSGSTETQTIQFDDQGRPLYSSNRYNNIKYINENRNLDICVADRAARAIVVVNQYGKLQYRYNGYHSNIEESFDPVGITTDSQSHILTTEHGYNGRIHILDQDEQFLRYIHNLHRPWDLCVDNRKNLFVVDYYTATVKKIQYL